MHQRALLTESLHLIEAYVNMQMCISVALVVRRSGWPTEGPFGGRLAKRWHSLSLSLSLSLSTLYSRSLTTLLHKTGLSYRQAMCSSSPLMDSHRIPLLCSIN